jgi:hypothetical protein
MAQRIYWVPHTICFLGCDHCHNDSCLEGIPSSKDVLDRCVSNLPSEESRYRLEEILIGGGDALVRHQHTEHLIRSLRQRYPQGPQNTVDERRAAGHAIIAVQTMGLPLCDGKGIPSPRLVDHWVSLGLDYFHVASSDIFHEHQRRDYPWETMRANLSDYGDKHGVHFHIYGKAPHKLVPSGRALEHMEELEARGASLLTDEGYCANGWETASNFLTGWARPYRACSEVVVDTAGWVHPCCWYELSPALFDLTKLGFDEGMDGLQGNAYCQALDKGDISKLGDLAGIEPGRARRVRDAVGDCGACRLFSARIAADGSGMRSVPLTERETTFYRQRVGDQIVDDLLQRD